MRLYGSYLRIVKWVLPLVTTCLGGLDAQDRARFPLVEDGRSVARVLLDREDVHVTPAVQELISCVKRITGAELELVSGTVDLPGPTLHIGETDHARSLSEARASIRVDGFAWHAVGEDLVVVGKLPQGTANGVWTMLQDSIGVRWYGDGPLWEVLPRRRTLRIDLETPVGSATRVENPTFSGRYFWGAPTSQGFSRRMRLTQPGTPLPYVGTGHSLDRVVPLEKYADSHPEYFAWMDGRRVTDRVSHPCFTHPDMPRIFMDYVRAGGGSFGVNDNQDACRCDRCIEVDGASARYMGIWSFSESYFGLMAEVARRTAREFPGRRLGAFAYQQTSSPPRTVDSVGDNVDVVLCQDTSQHYDEEVLVTDRRMSEEWVRKVGGVSMYDYYGIDYWTPRYFPSILAAQVKHTARAGVKGYLSHGSTMTDSAMPMMYLYCRLLWSSDLDPGLLIDEMLGDLYGEAREPIRRFYDHWEHCWLRQRKGRWFKGMDDLRGEMTIYSLEDIEHGWRLLGEAEDIATEEIVRKRIGFLKSSFAFTRAAARVHSVSLDATLGPAPSTPADVEHRIAEVVESWKAFAAQLSRSEELPGSSASGWHSKTFRVRAWGLKQQVRDAVLAPAVRWICTQEGRADAEVLRAAESRLAEEVEAARSSVEGEVTETVGAAWRLPRADPLRVADVPRVPGGDSATLESLDWSSLPEVSRTSWVFREAPAERDLGKYDEPMPQDVVDAPDPEDLSVTWRAGWSDAGLWIRVEVTDEHPVQSQADETIWKEDSLQMYLTPRRWCFEYPEHSWYFLMGGLRDEDLHLAIARREGSTVVVFRKVPDLQAEGVAVDLVRARTSRSGSTTVYETCLDWRLLPGFLPAGGRSFGITVLVSDHDGAGVRTAEYGGGVLPRRRPSEFAGLRLAD